MTWCSHDKPEPSRTSAECPLGRHLSWAPQSLDTRIKSLKLGTEKLSRSSISSPSCGMVVSQSLKSLCGLCICSRIFSKVPVVHVVVRQVVRQVVRRQKQQQCIKKPPTLRRPGPAGSQSIIQHRDGARTPTNGNSATWPEQRFSHGSDDGW